MAGELNRLFADWNPRVASDDDPASRRWRGQSLTPIHRRTGRRFRGLGSDSRARGIEGCLPTGCSRCRRSSIRPRPSQMSR